MATALIALAPPLVGADGPPPSIVRLPMPAEADQSRPVEVPTEPDNTVEVDFPWGVSDWAGRGFTPDPDKYAGDFVIEAARGSPRIFVTPVAPGAHRVLDVVLLGPAGQAQSVPVEFVPAPAGLAWRKLRLVAGSPSGRPAPAVSLEDAPPPPGRRAPGPDAELGMLRTLRLAAGMTPAGARALEGANPALTGAWAPGDPVGFGDFTLTRRFAIRDATTGLVGLCVSVQNPTHRRLFFGPGSWVVRAGTRVYPVRTVDFASEVQPGETACAFLVLGDAEDGTPTRLLAGNDFAVSVVESGSASTRPVVSMPVAESDP
ncbi:MAG TPA: hypothetical protein VGG34_05685 [Opitutaceae bacterium]|jgi:hypothetical protein